MENILCPTDFSVVADNAIVYAAKLSHQIGAELTLYNVQSLLEMTAIEMVRGKSLTIHSVMDRLENRCREITRVFKISCYPEVQPSVTSLVNLIETRARDFDLIVMGSDGANDYYQKIFGSSAYNIIRMSNSPILIIPPACGFQPLFLMIYAFDYLKDNDLPMKQLIPFVTDVQAKLAVLNVVNDPDSNHVEERLKGIQKKLKEENQDNFTILFDTVYSPEIAKSINSYVLLNEADVLALCTHHESFFERIFHKSVIKEVTQLASYPLFVFHE